MAQNKMFGQIINCSFSGDNVIFYTDFPKRIGLIIVFILGGCANLQTIDRTTTFPANPDRDGSIAIHLDAQQRLLLSNKLDRICAEPSPDALAAYAASLGLGVGIPSQGSGSLAEALQGSSGSIGLRTQSITLMRDILYRMCEAWMNRAIGPVQIATLLGRSLDLTAVILAVEQLTGAVAASQVVLAGSAGAGSSAAILSNQELLDAARQDEETKRSALEAAKRELEGTNSAITEKQAEVTSARTLYELAVASESGSSATEKAELKRDLDKKVSELDALKVLQTSRESNVKTKEQLLEEATKNRETIENIKDSALTSAVANTTAFGQFSVPVQRKQLSDMATKEIAQAVKDMVEKVLDKSYTEEACVALLSIRDEDPSNPDPGLEQAKEACYQLIYTNIRVEINRIQETNPKAFE